MDWLALLFKVLASITPSAIAKGGYRGDRAAKGRILISDPHVKAYRKCIMSSLSAGLLRKSAPERLQ